MTLIGPVTDCLKSWRLRRRFNLAPTDCVLEVGSGHAPYIESDVLLDRYIDTDHERGGNIVQNGRPLIQGAIGALPFETGSFDFSIASHAIEHVPDPAAALSELARVSDRGYLECPSLFWELFRPGREYHHWVILSIDGRLVFYPKNDIELPPFGTLFERGGLPSRSKFLSLFFNQYRSLFLIRRVWTGELEYVIEPDDDDLRRFFEGPYDLEMFDRLTAGHKTGHSQTVFRSIGEKIINLINT